MLNPAAEIKDMADASAIGFAWGRSQVSCRCSREARRGNARLVEYRAGSNGYLCIMELSMALNKKRQQIKH